MAQRYESYKNCRVQWLGEIPSHWKLVRVKSLLEERTEKSKTGTEEPLSMSQKYGIIPTKEMDVVPNAASSYIGAKIVYVGDIVFNKLKAHLGVFAISKYEGLVSPDYAVYYSKGLSDKQYIEYQFHTPLYIQEFKRHATGVAIGLTRLYTNQLYAIQSVCPPLEEQKCIVSYLDNKCSKIDEWVNKKEKEVEYLQELKQRVIADAVTRGINPNVTMKQTGVFWWKETPEHWGKIRLGYILQKMNRQRKPNSELLVCTNKGKVTKRGETKIGLIADSEEIYQGVEEGDLLIHGMDTWHGAIAVSSYKGMCTPVVHVCTSKENLYFVAYYMQVMAYSKIFKLISNGVRQNTSDFRSWAKVDKIPIMLPPKHEQDSIVAYIIDKTSKIDKLIANINKEIENIKEYKQRLISDVVTGQIKVC